MVIVPLLKHRDRLYGWDYADNSNCDLEHSTRRIVIESDRFTFQELDEGQWRETWTTELSNIKSICRFTWHSMNPPDALDGMEIKLHRRRKGVGRIINLQSVRGVCEKDPLDMAERFLRERGIVALCSENAS